MARNGSINVFTWKQCEIDGALELRAPLLDCAASGCWTGKINIELERSNNECFAYIASHDLKEPLRGIHNYSSFLIEDYADVLNVEGVWNCKPWCVWPKGRLDWVPTAFFSSGTGGTLDAEDQPERISENVIDVLSISLKDTKVDIRISALPVIQCDQIQISEVFSNLISNAIKYNDKAENRWRFWQYWMAILNLELDDSREKFLTEDQTNNQKSKIKIPN